MSIVKFEGRKYEIDDDCFVVDDGEYNNTAYGEDYDARYHCSGVDAMGNSVEVVWEFLQTKGSEQELDMLDWDDKNAIVKVIEK